MSNNGHNVEIKNKRQQKRCPECGKKTRTVHHPNIKQHGSRMSDYLVVCDNCKKAYFLLYCDYNVVK